jgi:hypothetical protein
LRFTHFGTPETLSLLADASRSAPSPGRAPNGGEFSGNKTHLCRGLRWHILVSGQPPRKGQKLNSQP